MAIPKVILKKRERKKQIKDDKFISLLKELNNINGINQNITNEIIKKYYTDLPFDTSTKKIYIRALIKYEMSNMQYNLFDMERVFELIYKIYSKLYQNPATLDNYFTLDVRQPVFKRWPSKDGKESEEYMLSKEIASLPYEVKEELMKDATEKVESKNRNSNIIYIDEIYDIIKNNINSENPFKVAVALLLCCGSREIEFFSNSNYEIAKVPNGEKNWIIQSNIAKKKGQEYSVIKPLLYLNANEFIEKLEKMRSDINKLYGKIIKDGVLSSSISSRVTDTAKEIFNYKKGFTLHIARKIYAHMTYDIYQLKETIHGKVVSLIFWLSSVLGHNGLGAIANYTHIKLVNGKSKDSEKNEFSEVIVKNDKIENQMKEIDKIFKNYVSTEGTQPTQNNMEKLAKDVAPRRIIRLYMKSKK